MRALRYHGPRDMRLEDLPEPVPPPGWALVEVSWVGICGTDLHEYLAGPLYVPASSVPLVLGHEFSGVVRTAPAGSQVRAGDRVAVDALVRCGSCWFCERGLYHLCDHLEVVGLSRDGALATYVAVPTHGLHPLPESISDEAAVLVEIFSCGVHSVRRGRVTIGESAAVVGAGPMGLVVTAAAAAVGAYPIISVEPVAARRDRALALGATHAVDPGAGDAVEQVRELTRGRGADVTFECVGKETTLRVAVEAARKRGRVVVTGVFEEQASLSFNEVVLSERELIGSVSYQFDHARAVALMSSGRVDLTPMITSRLGLAEASTGFEQLASRKEEGVKVLITPRS
jgi:(R,R)-butanediol dehydrogenase / meso-butanediol dehydrogenase / diacetyl reductase